MNKYIEKYEYENFMENIRGTGDGRVYETRMITVPDKSTLEKEMKRVISLYKKYIGCFKEDCFYIEQSEYPICVLSCGFEKCGF
jgi:hypothetical protein